MKYKQTQSIERGSEEPYEKLLNINKMLNGE